MQRDSNGKSEGDCTMPNPWVVTLRGYEFNIVASATNERIDLSCYVTDASTGTPQYGSPQYLGLVYDPNNTATLQGNIFGSDNSYQILLSTNSSVFMQHVQWALTLPENIYKLFWITGSPSATTGGYPYTVDTCFLYPLTQEPALLAADIALPENTADMPEELRTALQRRREHQVRLSAAHLGAAPNAKLSLGQMT
jgi:hypothetical protein